MPGTTKQGTIWAQWTAYTWVSNGSYTHKVMPNHRDITAYSSLSESSLVIPGHHHSWGSGEPPHASFGFTGIWKIVAGGHSEEFEPFLPRIQRDDVTEIWFKTDAFDLAFVKAVHVINYWNSEQVFFPD